MIETHIQDVIKGELSTIDVPGIDMVLSFEEFASVDYDNYSAVFIGGGNTFKLLKGLKESDSFKKLKKFVNKDGVVFGGSAGAVVFGYDITCCGCMDENEVNLIDTKGFDILNGKSVFAHYTNTESELNAEENEIRTQRFTNYLYSVSNKIGDIVALPEEDTIFVNGNTIEIIGSKPYYVFKAGTRIRKELI